MPVITCVLAPDHAITMVVYSATSASGRKRTFALRADVDVTVRTVQFVLLSRQKLM